MSELLFVKTLSSLGREVSAVPLAEFPGAEKYSILQRTLSIFLPEATWRPPQWAVLQEGWLTPGNGILEASTAVGKSLLALARMAQIVLDGGSVVYISPLKALAEEKRIEFTHFFNLLRRQGAPRTKIVLTTGDITLDRSHFTDLPEKAQITLTTPERLDAILRNPATNLWLSNQRLIVVDEVHLLDDSRRGPHLEALLTRLKLLPHKPELRLLSATIGNAEALAEWLQARVFPNDSDLRRWRDPPLHLGLVTAETETEVLNWVESMLNQNPQNSFLIFRYRVDSVNKLVRTLGDRKIEAAAWHSKIPRAGKTEIRRKLDSGNLRVVVSTSALAMGVNLPTTHVLIMDTKKGPIDLTGRELLQMLGRSGRNHHPGHGVLWAKPDQRNQLEKLLQTLTVPPIRPKLGEGDELHAQILAELSHRGGEVALAELEDFFSATWNGRENPPLLQSAIADLLDWFLIERTEEGRYKTRPLGYWVAQAYLPPLHAAGMAKLLRDLIRLSKQGINLIPRLSALDFLVIVLAYQERIPYKPKYDQFLSQYHLRLRTEERSQLFTQFFEKVQEPHRLLNSLLVKTKKPDLVLKEIVWNGLILYDYAQGLPLLSVASGQPSLEQRYGLTKEEKVFLEEKLLSNVLWYLNGLVGMTDPARAYRMAEISQRAQQVLQQLSLQLTYHSPLGLLAQLKHVGKGTIARLTQAGYSDVSDVKQSTRDDLVTLGIKGKSLESLLFWQSQ